MQALPVLGRVVVVRTLGCHRLELGLVLAGVHWSMWVQRVRVDVVEGVFRLLKHTASVAVVHDPVFLPVGGDTLRHIGGDDWGVAVLHPRLCPRQAILLAVAGARSISLGSVIRVVEIKLVVVRLTVAVSTQESDPAGVLLSSCLDLGVEVSSERLLLGNSSF